MEDRHAVAEPPAEASHGLRRERDLGHQHDRPEPALERGAARLEVDLGLAAPGGPVEQDVLPDPLVERRHDLRDRCALLGGELRRLRLALERLARDGRRTLAPRRASQGRHELERAGWRRAVVVRDPQREVDERRRDVVHETPDDRGLDPGRRLDADVRDHPAHGAAAEPHRDDRALADSLGDLVRERPDERASRDERVDGRKRHGSGQRTRPPGRRRSEGRVDSAPMAGHGHSTDEYLEVIYFLAFPIGEYRPAGESAIASRVAEMLGVSRASAGEMLKRLESEGLVERGEQKEAILTPAGIARAEKVVRKHRIIERFLTDFMGYTASESHVHADEMGDTFTEDMVERMYERLGRPDRCPHGWPVDPEVEQRENVGLVALADLEPGQGGEIVRLAEHDGELLHWFYDEGFVPGSSVEIREAQPAAGQLKVALDEIDRAIAEKAAQGLYVRVAA